MINNASLRIFHVGEPLAVAGQADKATDRLNARLEEIGINKRVLGQRLGPALVEINTGYVPTDWNLGAELSLVDMAHLRATCKQMHDLDMAEIALQNSGRTLSQLLRLLRERDPEALSALLRDRGVTSFGALGLVPQDLETLQIIVGSSKKLAEVLQSAENQVRFKRGI